MKPPANVSPAPVGSTTSSSGYAGAANTPCSWNRSAPDSPRLTITVFGPIARIARAARGRLCSFDKLARLLVVDDEQVDALEHLRQRSPSSPSIQKFIVSIATRRGLRTCVEHVELQRRVDVAEEQELRVAPRLGQPRLEVGEHVELRVERGARRQILRVAPLPAEGLALGALEAGRGRRRASRGTSGAAPGSPRRRPPPAGPARSTTPPSRRTKPSRRARHRARCRWPRPNRAPPSRRRPIPCSFLSTPVFVHDDAEPLARRSPESPRAPSSPRAPPPTCTRTRAPRGCARPRPSRSPWPATRSS